MADLFRPKKKVPIPPDAIRVAKAGKAYVRIDGELYPVADGSTHYVRLDPKWCADIRGADGKRRRVRLSTDKQAADVMLAELLKRIELEKAGVLTPVTAHQSRSLMELLAEYRSHHGDKGNTPEQTAQAVRRCELVFSGCGFVTLADLDATAAERWLSAKRATPKAEGGFGARTSSHYVTALKAFGNWLVKARRSAENPFRFLGKVNTDVDVRHVRRPLSAASTSSPTSSMRRRGATRFAGCPGRAGRCCTRWPR